MIFLIPERVQTSSGAHPTFSEYFRLSLQVEWPGHEADHSTLSMELYLHSHKLIHGVLIKQWRDHFIQLLDHKKYYCNELCKNRQQQYGQDIWFRIRTSTGNLGHQF